MQMPVAHMTCDTTLSGSWLLASVTNLDLCKSNRGVSLFSPKSSAMTISTQLLGGNRYN